jgi:hypothetical protein
MSVDHIGRTHGSAAGAPTLEMDMDATLYDLNVAFNPLHRDCLLDYQVTSSSASHVCMSVAMPREMLIAFSTILESMGGFFRAVSRRAKVVSAQNRILDLSIIEARKNCIESFNSECLQLFDDFVKQGHEKREAVKLTNFALKAKNSPYASNYIVEKTLRAAGRLRKNCSKDGVL